MNLARILSDISSEREEKLRRRMKEGYGKVVLGSTGGRSCRSRWSSAGSGEGE